MKKKSLFLLFFLFTVSILVGCGEEPNTICEKHVQYETILSEATCDSEGRKAINCKNCNYSYTEVIPAKGHQVVTDNEVKSTCTSTGLTEGSHCSECGTVLVPQQVTNALGHNPGSVVVENSIESTCKVKGSYDNVTYCTSCNHEISRETVTLDLLEHIEVTDYGYPASCTENGLTEGSHCSRCNDVLVEQTVITGSHNYGEWELTLEPTTSVAGMLTKTCSNDPEHKETFELPALTDSNYVIGEEGVYTTYTYSKDNQSFVVKVLNFVLELNSTEDGYVLVKYNGNSETVEIPSEYNGLPIVTIAQEAFLNNTTLKTLVIPNSVTLIEFKAISNCTKLENITVPFVGEKVSGTANVHFGYIFGAYDSGSNRSYVPQTLKEVTVGGNTIGYEAFRGLKYITKINVQEGVHTFGIGAFSYCEALETISIPSTVTEINSSFNNCYKLANIYYGGTIDEWCNIDFSQTDFVSLPFHSNSISNILESHFYMLDNNNEYFEVKEITIPENITEIGMYQFYGFNCVETFVVHNKVTEVGYMAFTGCDKAYKEYDKVGYIGNETNPYLILVKAKDTTISECVVNENTKFICASAFSGCRNLGSVEIAGSVKEISNSVFYNCTSLHTVVIKEGVETIGSQAFYYCTSLENLSLPTTLKTISNSAFASCRNLVNVSLNEGLTYLGTNAFQGCTKLETISIPTSLDTILSYTFQGCTSLQEISLPNSITSIGDGAFGGCTNLTTVELPNSIKNIGADVFSGCTSLTYYEDSYAKYLGNSNNNYVVLVEVKNKNTYSCTIASTTKVIADYAFSGCKILII